MALGRTALGSTLTTVVGRANMRRSMVQKTSYTGRFATWALALAVAMASAATCVLGAEATEAQKACCAAMSHDCGAMAVEQDCCVADSPNLAGPTSAPPTSVLAPPAPLALNTIVAEPVAALGRGFDSRTPKPSRTPTYLLVSVFRI